MNFKNGLLRATFFALAGFTLDGANACDTQTISVANWSIIHINNNAQVSVNLKSNALKGIASAYASVILADMDDNVLLSVQLDRNLRFPPGKTTHILQNIGKEDAIAHMQSKDLKAYVCLWNAAYQDNITRQQP